MNYKYPKQFTMDFISMWRERECLWKRTHPHYYKKEYREKAYDELLVKLREVVPTATRKILVRRLELYRLSSKKHALDMVRAARRGSTKPIIPPQSWTFPLLIFLYEHRLKNLRSICASVGIREEDVTADDDTEERSPRYALCGKRIDGGPESDSFLDESEHHRVFEELIAIYRTFPCLWRKFPADELPLPDSSRTKLKMAAKEILLDKLREIYPQAQSVTYRLSELRRGFKRELARLLEARAEEREYNPKLWCFNSLTFLAQQESGDLYHLLEEHEIDVVSEEEEAAAARAALEIMESKSTPKKQEDVEKALTPHSASKMTTRRSAKKEFQSAFLECIQTGPIFGKPLNIKRISETEDFTQRVEEIVDQMDDSVDGGDYSDTREYESDDYVEYADSVNEAEAPPSEHDVEVLYTSEPKPDPLSNVKTNVSKHSDTRDDAATVDDDTRNRSQKVPWWKRAHRTKEIVPKPAPTPIKRERPSVQREWSTPTEEPPRSSRKAPPMEAENGRESAECCQRNCSPGDRYEASGRLLAVRLRHLDAVQRIRAEKLIGDVLYHAELGALDKDSAVVVSESIEEYTVL